MQHHPVVAAYALHPVYSSCILCILHKSSRPIRASLRAHMASNLRQPLQVESRKDYKIGDSFEPTICSQFHLIDPDQCYTSSLSLLHGRLSLPPSWSQQTKSLKVGPSVWLGVGGEAGQLGPHTGLQCHSNHSGPLCQSDISAIVDCSANWGYAGLQCNSKGP